MAGAILVGGPTGFRIAAVDPDALLAARVRPLILSGGIPSLHVPFSVGLPAVAAGHLGHLVRTRGLSALRATARTAREGAPAARGSGATSGPTRLPFVLLGGMAAMGRRLHAGWEPVSPVSPAWEAALHVRRA